VPELVVDLPPFFFAFAVDLVCATAIDPVIRNALIQKLAANFRYRLIGVSQVTSSQPLPVQSRQCAWSIPLPRHHTLPVAALHLL
jgi:hypothetical protein